MGPLPHDISELLPRFRTFFESVLPSTGPHTILTETPSLPPSPPSTPIDDTTYKPFPKKLLVVGGSMVCSYYLFFFTSQPSVEQTSASYLLVILGLSICIPTIETAAAQKCMQFLFIINIAAGTHGIIEEYQNHIKPTFHRRLRTIPHLANVIVFGIGAVCNILYPNHKAFDLWNLFRLASVLEQGVMLTMGTYAYFCSTSEAPITLQPGNTLPEMYIFVWTLPWFLITVYLSRARRRRLSKLFFNF
jgi:hypothetical protein